MFLYPIKSSFLHLRQEILLILLSLVAILIFIPIFTYSYFARDLMSTAGIMNRTNTGVILYDRNGKEFFKFYEAKYQQFVPLTAMPKHVRQAVIVAEDKEFYQHPGFSVRSIFAAMIANIRSRDLSYGGSTITQQLVKNSLLHPKKDFLRKYEELVLASEIERRYSKDQILEMYLNSVYFGEGAFGIEAASQTYFGVSVDKLTVPQSALLAGILTAPSRLSPLSGDSTLSRVRQEYVLQQLFEEGYITNEALQQAKGTRLAFSTVKKGFPYKAPHFALLVRDQLIKKYGEEKIARSGFKVYTTLDLTMQAYAEKVVEEQVQALAANNVTNGAAVVIDPENGEVLVLVGSSSWENPKWGKVNMAASPRQPGSSFKPIIYAAALDRGLITPGSTLLDRPTTFPVNYRPKNYDNKFRGPVSVRRALANSLNVPAVQVMQKLGVEEGLTTAKNFGISTLGASSDYGLSLVLGSGEVPLLEMTNAYAIFANNGNRHDIALIQAIENKSGENVYDHTPKSTTVIDAKTAFLISSMLSDNQARREVFGNVLANSQQAAVKTGTSEDYRDSLTIGYTPKLTIGVWVGNNDNKPMSKVAGSIGAAPIWRSLIGEFSEQNTVAKFTAPEGVVASTVCGEGVGASGSARTEYFVAGTQPFRTCRKRAPVVHAERPAPSVSPVPESTPVPTAVPL